MEKLMVMLLLEQCNNGQNVKVPPFNLVTHFDATEAGRQKPQVFRLGERTVFEGLFPLEDQLWGARLRLVLGLSSDLLFSSAAEPAVHSC